MTEEFSAGSNHPALQRTLRIEKEAAGRSFTCFYDSILNIYLPPGLLRHSDNEPSISKVCGPGSCRRFLQPGKFGKKQGGICFGQRPAGIWHAGKNIDLDVNGSHMRNGLERLSSGCSSSQNPSTKTLCAGCSFLLLQGKSLPIVNVPPANPNHSDGIRLCSDCKGFHRQQGRCKEESNAQWHQHILEHSKHSIASAGKSIR